MVCHVNTFVVLVPVPEDWCRCKVKLKTSYFNFSVGVAMPGNYNNKNICASASFVWPASAEIDCDSDDLARYWYRMLKTTHQTCSPNRR